jgi:hypothetical protein
MNEDEIGGILVCGTHVKKEKCIEDFVGKPAGKERLDGSKMDLKEVRWEAMDSIGFIKLRM